MKKFIVVVLMCLGTQAYAEVEKVNVCGIHQISIDGRHFLNVYAGNLQNGLYKLFASNQRAAILLNTMKPNSNYCVIVGFNFDRPNEWISLISIQ